MPQSPAPGDIHPLIAPTGQDLLDRLNDLHPTPKNPQWEGLLPPRKANPATRPDAYLNHLALTAHPDLPAHLLHLKNTLPPDTPLFLTLLGDGTTHAPQQLTPAHNRPFPTIQTAGDLLTRMQLALPVVDSYQVENWHILTLHAHTPGANQPQPKRRGTGQISLVRILSPK